MCCDGQRRPKPADTARVGVPTNSSQARAIGAPPSRVSSDAQAARHRSERAAAWCQPGEGERPSVYVIQSTVVGFEWNHHCHRGDHSFRDAAGSVPT